MTLTQAFLNQSESCSRMGSPFMGRVLKILASRWDTNSALGQRMAEYDGDIGPAGHSLPLRICAGLHALVLQANDLELAAAYPPNDTDDATLEKAVVNALENSEEFLLRWTESAPQTNEVRRSAALIAMAHVATSYFDRPIILSELGASGGLNLMWDHFALDVKGNRFGPQDAVLTLKPDWTGAVPPAVYPQIVDRSGVDLNPLDLKEEADNLRLLSYLWPDQPHRVELTRAAMSVLSTRPDKGDAVDWLETRLASHPNGHMHMIQHTVAWQYFPVEKQRYGAAIIEEAGARATPEAPLAWMQMETDGDTTGAIGAALILRLWPGDITLNLGRADFHGRWINWAA